MLSFSDLFRKTLRSRVAYSYLPLTCVNGWIVRLFAELRTRRTFFLTQREKSYIMLHMSGNPRLRMPTKTLGAFLREKRRLEGFSIRKLVDATKEISSSGEAGISSAHICDIENGRRIPSDEVLTLLVKVLKITEEELDLYDTRVPNLEIQELTQMNALYGVAFRRMVKHIQKNDVSPEEILQSMINNFDK